MVGDRQEPTAAGTWLCPVGSDLERQQEVASGLDDLVRAARGKARQKPSGEPSGADLVRDA
ncbi:hypothetical protein GCM10010416_06840 [Streptomyces caniferus]